MLGLPTQSGSDGLGRTVGDRGGCFGVVLGALFQLEESELLGAQNTWTKYREEYMEDGK